MSVFKQLSQSEIAEIVETSEQDLWKSIWEHASPSLEQDMDMHLYEFGAASGIAMRKLPNIVLNRVIGLGIKEPATESVVDEFITAYTQSETPWAIALSPQAHPADLTDWLMKRGFTQTTNTAKMIRDNRPPEKIESNLRVERIDKAQSAQLFADLNSRAFGVVGWFTRLVEGTVSIDGNHGYIAYDGDTPIGTGMLRVWGEIGVLHHGATLPEYRRLGAQTAIMAKRIQDGIDLGCRWFVTETNESTPETPNPSHHNMLRAGFELAYLRPKYVYQPD